MSEEKETKLRFFKNAKELVSINRSEIAELKETHDGLTVNLKSSIHIYVTDAYMNRETKMKIVTTDKFKNSNIDVDLSNPGRPVQVMPV